MIYHIMIFVFFSFFVGAAHAQTEVSSHDFSDYPADLYSGKIKVPDYFKKDDDGFWRDEFGKLIEDPQINFAGKYFISRHSCGTGCRYYRLTDLTIGEDIPILDMFSTTTPPPKTRDGFRYITVLQFSAGSRLIVAKYMIDKNSTEECRERIFIIDGDHIKPITLTRACSKFLSP